MNQLNVLDCTLRDGGYCNNWKFGFENIKRITNGLVEAGLDIIECGFLTNKVEFNSNITKFTKISEFTNVIPKEKNGKMFVAMMNYGEYEIKDIPRYDGTSIDGIRVAFHKKNWAEALKLCKEIKEKGYKVFIQAMVSLSYSDSEFLNMIERVNEFKPYAFYIVDSFGMMKSKDVIRLFYIIEHNLDREIWIGFHSHNNLQLAYSNAKQLVNVQTNRNLIIDSSIYGMGRGAGNLNTELFLEYLNDNINSKYKLTPLFKIIDEILNECYQRNYWGYSLPNYISAIHNAHPNYAGYLDDKKKLTFKEMNDIFDMMDNERKVSFDKDYIEDLYIKYMNLGNINNNNYNKLKEQLKNKKVLLIAPGKSVYEYEEMILKFLNDNQDIVCISVNFSYTKVNIDYIFSSNIRRFNELPITDYNKCIVTSNIAAKDTYVQVNYNELLNDNENVKDNAGMMAIKFLILNDVKKIYLAGFDGYTHDDNQNYVNEKLSFVTKNNILDEMNKGISKTLSEFAKQINMEFLTPVKFVNF